MNANFTDVASEITNSLPRDGQAAMTGQFKAASGSPSVPSISFGADSDTGFYRKSANTIGVVAGGVEVGTIGSGGFSSFPTGTHMLFYQTSAPPGWTKKTEADFNDRALRVTTGTVTNGGTTGFTSVFAARTILEANMPSHTHTYSTTTGSGGAHTHSVSGGTIAGTSTTSTLRNDGSSSGNTGGSTIVIDSGGAHTHSVSGTTNNTGSGTAMDFAVKYLDIIVAVKD